MLQPNMAAYHLPKELFPRAIQENCQLIRNAHKLTLKLLCKMPEIKGLIEPALMQYILSKETDTIGWDKAREYLIGNVSLEGFERILPYYLAANKFSLEIASIIEKFEGRDLEYYMQGAFLHNSGSDLLERMQKLGITLSQRGRDSIVDPIEKEIVNAYVEITGYDDKRENKTREFLESLIDVDINALREGSLHQAYEFPEEIVKSISLAREGGISGLTDYEQFRIPKVAEQQVSENKSFVKQIGGFEITISWKK